MKIRFLTPAKVEYLEAVNFYNLEKSGLGYEFAAEVDKTLSRMKQFPHGWQKISKNIRRCRLSRFPYSVFYSVHKDEIIVVAVSHSRREPQHWKKRI